MAAEVLTDVDLSVERGQFVAIVGALLLGRDVACTPLLHGGGQERDVRSGTLDVPGVTAFSVAVTLASSRKTSAPLKRPGSVRR